MTANDNSRTQGAILDFDSFLLFFFFFSPRLRSSLRTALLSGLICLGWRRRESGWGFGFFFYRRRRPATRVTVIDVVFSFFLLSAARKQKKCGSFCIDSYCAVHITSVGDAFLCVSLREELIYWWFFICCRRRTEFRHGSTLWLRFPEDLIDIRRGHPASSPTIHLGFFGLVHSNERWIIPNRTAGSITRVFQI